MLEKEMCKKPRKISKAVEEMRRQDRLCKRLFPQHFIHPELGELLFIVREGELRRCKEEEIQQAGNWWLWARTLFIENTMTKTMKKIIRKIALGSAQGGQPIHFVSARSPEWVHSQIRSQGDANLPRSRKAIQDLCNLIDKSAGFLPTRGTILLADVAIDNLQEIQKRCLDLERVIQENFFRLQGLIEERQTTHLSLGRLSGLLHPTGRTIGEIVNPDGSPKIQVDLNPKAIRLIETVLRESIDSHRRMFGWTESESKRHNTNLAITMGLVGQAIKIIRPDPILLHNEAFISRGALNNIFTNPNDPLPVLCLSSLLEKK